MATGEESISQLRAVLTELNELASLAKQPRVKSLLEREARTLTQEIGEIEQRKSAAAAASVESKPTIPTKQLHNFSFDESDKFVKLYVSECMTDVQKLPADSVSSEFTERSFRVLVKNLGGLNYEFAVTNLLKPIDVQGSYAKQRENELVIMLKKKVPESWKVLTQQERRMQQAKEERDRKMYGSANKEEGGEDPGANIMGMMRRMYDEGDDNMKRVIAEAWTKSRDKSGQMPGDF